MIKKRINTDLPLSLTLLNKDGSVPDLSKAYDITVAIINSKTKAEYPQTYTLANNVLTLQYSSVENTELGYFNVRFGWKENNANSETEYYQYFIDFSYVFQIVPISEEEDGSYAKMTGTVSVYGANGLSAYELAVRNGYTGTESVWLESLRLHFGDLTASEIAALQQPAADKAAELETAVSDTAEFLRLADLAETGREQAESSRVTAESGRVSAESAREISFSASKTAADAATVAANDAAGKFGSAVVQVVGTNTDKVISQNALTVLLNAITDNASLQGNVIAEAIVLLLNEVNVLKERLANGNLGDIHVTSITSDSMYMYCGQSLVIKGSGSPITNAVLPAFEGQIYIDTTNRNVYMSADSSSATYWKQLN